ncbi:MAG: energy-coupling factor transporter ATPase [Firmicutes bacterium]|nr:energy-coupling factor transporter ATPase [Candidatus Colimorpha enterica]
MGKIEIKNVTYTYSKDTPFEKAALKDVSAVFEDNRITGLIGHTGCGKSTLVQLFNGLLVPDCGEVLIDGVNVSAKGTDKRALRFRVGLVFQYPEYQLFEETVAADIAFGPKNMGLDDGEIKRRTLEALKFVGLPPTILSESPFDLSGGQKRRVAIAGVLAMEPEVLVLDEPAAGLDPAGRDSIFGGIREYQKETGRSVIIVSHSMEDMAEYTDDIVVMQEGRVKASGRTKDIFRQREMLEEAGLSVPGITLFMTELKRKGGGIDVGVFTVSDAFEEIKKYVEGVKKQC